MFINRKTFIKQWAVGAAAMTLAGTRTQGASSAPRKYPQLTIQRSLRRLFIIEPDRLYLNTGGLGPPSQTVIDTVHRQTLQQAKEGETYHGIFASVRDNLARFFGAEAAEVSFTRSASEGNSIIAAGLRLSPGDEIVFESHAHPGGSIPWLVRQKERGVRVRVFEPDSQDPANNLDRILSIVNDRTRVIQLSHLTAPTGIMFDIAAIAKETRKRGIWLHVDGAQSAGMIPIDLHELDCDSYATSGHKWLNGPQETGFLYIKKGQINQVGCAHGGAYTALDFKLPDFMTYLPAVQRHEYGTRDAASIAGLNAAIELQESIGIDRIADHGRQLVDLARTALEAIPRVEILTPSHAKMYNSMITFRSPNADCEQITSQLMKEHGIRSRMVTECNLNAVRVSFHLYNEAADVDRLAQAVRNCLGY